MSEIWQPSDINGDTINQLFNDAYMESSVDEDKEVRVEENGLYLYVNARKDGCAITMLASFSFSEQSTETERLAFANRMNNEYVFVRSYAIKDSLVVDYMLRTDAGTTKKTLVLALKLFSRICRTVWEEGREKDSILR